MPETRDHPGVGGLLQTLAIGPQEKHLYNLEETCLGNPFTNVKRLKTTRGALEVKDQEFSPFLFNSINRTEIQRQGDMLGDIVLQITLPSISGASQNDYWKPNIGYILLRHVRLLLNDIELSGSERLFFDLYERLFETDSTRRALRDMIGGEGVDQLRLTRSHTIFIPMKLFTSKRRNGGQTFMPMLSTPGSSLYLEIETESFENCVTSYGGKSPPRLLPCTILTEYVYLDDDEKEYIINTENHTILVETVQDAEAFSFREVFSPDGLNQIIKSSSVVVSLKEMNFPAKAILFAAYSTSDLQNGDYFQYKDIIESVSIRFNSNDRTEGSEPNEYYRLIQPYLHAPRCIPDNIFFYSFALDSSLLQPTGVFTLSNIKEADLYITLKEPRDDIIVKTFVVGYSFLKFSNGFATSLYS